MRSFAFAALVLAGITAPALAQSAPTPYEPFTGLRVEGLAGLDRARNHGHDDGVAYGVGIGYDLQMRGVLIGAEGEFSDSTTKQCYGETTVADPRICANAGRDFYAGGRIGTVVGGRALLYAKAGYTNARVRYTGNEGDGRFGLGRDNLDGLRVGAGAEYALGPNTFVKAEYRYSNYEQHFSRNQVVGGFGFRF